ncbi:serine hydrolase domain-containing protein [Flavobacterium hercynium]|uniref:Serine hydrolase n=1 Tax=Flavobacterium hercynium TaxID=387094 RepID=A0A226HG12_9FLAO|nr:serine hydrolase domain-containing protein [Flavobacterium hercynium]OXA93217.1 serine hydrolase [Flavobacterium hercynium]SMP36086.1 CubicO group peptidase, beta-lactamase class C family [Flavobacterium hercynium]
MNSFLKISFLFAFVIFSSCNSTAQKKEDYTAKIDSLIKVANPKFNGAILISKNGKTLYKKIHGVTDLTTKKPLQQDSQFEIMSNGKLITAVLVLLEVEQGKIDVNAPIKKYLPQLTQPWADSVKVHQLLNHSHGIIALDKPLLFKPGSDYKYGNLNFSLLGKIVEGTSGKSYSDLANALFRKLKMKNTNVYVKGQFPNLVTGYSIENNVYKPVTNSMINPENLGAVGILSTVDDLAIWNNNLHKGKIIKPETYQLLLRYTILSQHNFFGKEKEGYGYGIRIIEKEAVKYIGHTGLGDGFSSVNIYFPESDVSLIVMENIMPDNPDLFYATEFKIKNILLKSTLLQKM